ncbi:OTU5 [Scenedesmus sp. PABB004]|nr:OTU5 [Scenedesmus sp. PABB004]
MGRKGMKGFMKSAARPGAKAEDEAPEAAPEQPAASGAPPPQQQQQPTASAGDGGGDGSDGEGGPESRSKMLQRHKRELLAHKKAAQRMGKTKKDEAAKLEAELEARHARELAALDAGAAAAGGASSAAAGSGAAGAAAAGGGAAPATAVAGGAAAADRASKYLVDLSIVGEEAGNGEAEQGKPGKKPTKAQKRRDKAAARDAERDARIAAELDALGPSEREEEEKALRALLAPLGLGIKEIRADGHCLYRSLEDQLEATAEAAAAAAGGDGDGDGDGAAAAAAVPNYQELRELAAEYIRQHKDEFSPFLLPEDEDEDPDAHYERYCYALETTAAWGGHLELQALARALRRQIRVHAVGMAALSVGDEHAGAAPPLEVCYLRHAFGLGEHYNSTKPARFVRFAAAEEEEGEEGGAGGGDGESGSSEGDEEGA